jgi:hypothetical protein
MHEKKTKKKKNHCFCKVSICVLNATTPIAAWKAHSQAQMLGSKKKNALAWDVSLGLSYEAALP